MDAINSAGWIGGNRSGGRPLDAWVVNRVHTEYALDSRSGGYLSAERAKPTHNLVLV